MEIECLQGRALKSERRCGVCAWFVALQLEFGHSDVFMFSGWNLEHLHTMPSSYFSFTRCISNQVKIQKRLKYLN